MILVQKSLAAVQMAERRARRLMQKDYGVIHLNYLIPSSPVANHHV
jgi:hypothetical protein